MYLMQELELIVEGDPVLMREGARGIMQDSTDCIEDMATFIYLTVYRGHV